MQAMTCFSKNKINFDMEKIKKNKKTKKVDIWMKKLVMKFTDKAKFQGYIYCKVLIRCTISKIIHLAF